VTTPTGPAAGRTAASPGGEEEQLVGRCYTSARRLPYQVGTFGNGARIWGGPYSLTQLTVMIGVFIVLVVTRSVWGGHGLVDLVVILAVPYAAGWSIARVHIDHRNPVAAIASLAGAVAAPRAGKLHGRPVRRRPAERLSPVVTVDLDPRRAGSEAESARQGLARAEGTGRRAASTVGRGAPVAPADRPAAVATAPLVSGVQALLAQRAAQKGAQR
jgi:hypothetical protein